MFLNGYRNNPFDDADIDYIKSLYYTHFPYTYNHLLYIDNRRMTTKQVAELCSNLVQLWINNINEVYTADSTKWNELKVEFNKLNNIIQKVQNELANEISLRDLLLTSARPRDWTQLFAQNYNRTMQPEMNMETFLPLPSQRPKILNEELEANDNMYGGVHTMDAFCKKVDNEKMRNMFPYLDASNYDKEGQKRLFHPWDEWIIDNVNNGTATMPNAIRRPHRRCLF